METEVMEVIIKIDMFARTQTYMLRDKSTHEYEEGSFFLAETRKTLNDLTSKYNILNIKITCPIPDYVYGLIKGEEYANVVHYKRDKKYSGYFNNSFLEIEKEKK